MLVRNIIVLCALIIVVGIGVYFALTKNDRSSERLQAQIGEAHIYVTQAVTLEERIQGLSGKRSLPEDEGLLFVFQESGLHGIWMKDMAFPIDIMWLNADRQIVDIKEFATPESYPEVFKPTMLSSFVLEVNAGFAEKNQIKIGDSFNFI